MSEKEPKNIGDIVKKTGSRRISILDIKDLLQRYIDENEKERAEYNELLKSDKLSNTEALDIRIDKTICTHIILTLKEIGKGIL